MDVDKTKGEGREDGLRLIARMMSPEAAKAFDSAKANGGFGSEMSELALQNIFSKLWTRPGLDSRSRSLVTLGILIALRASEELRYHFAIALKNGLSVNEIEEILYHATGYAGFPAASSAMLVAKDVLKANGAIQ